mgnify:CR=1 FL=1
MIDYQEIGNNIKICRIRCNLKQAELAEMVGVTSQHISHVERCQTKPSLTLLVDISTALRRSRSNCACLCAKRLWSMARATSSNKSAAGC